MPRFYFNFRNSNIVAEDKEGIDLPSLDEARRTALESAREVLLNTSRRILKHRWKLSSFPTQAGRRF
jgi:hypothetical protein